MLTISWRISHKGHEAHEVFFLCVLGAFVGTLHRHITLDLTLTV